MKSKNRENFEAHLSTNWHIYLIYAIIAIFIWSYAVVLFTKDKPKEVVTMWILSYGINEEELVNKLESSKPEYLKHVRVNFVDRNDQFANIKYQGLGIDCDIVILPESYINGTSTLASFINLDTEFIKNNIGDVEFYNIESRTFGIKIFDKTSDDDELIKYKDDSDETEDDNYYVFLNKKSLHMGSLNNSNFDGGIDVLRMLLEYEHIL